MPTREERIYNRPRPGVATSGEMITETAHAESLNPAEIAEQLMAGERPQVPLAPARYADARGPQSLQDAIELINSRREQFEELPARVRQAADNDVVVYEQMLLDQDGRAKLEAAGLEFEEEQAPAEPAEPPTPPPSEPVTEPAAQPAE